LERLDGIGCLEYDEERGRIEEAILREQIEQYKLRMREFEERQRLYKLAHAEHQKKTGSNAATATATATSKSEVSVRLLSLPSISSWHSIVTSIPMVSRSHLHAVLCAATNPIRECDC